MLSGTFGLICPMLNVVMWTEEMFSFSWKFAFSVIQCRELENQLSVLGIVLREWRTD